MATNFPTSVDNFTNPTANDSLNLPSHSTQHANANDAIESIETWLLANARIKQVKSATIYGGGSSSSTTYTDAATVSITPTSLTSKIFCLATFSYARKTTGNTDTTLDVELLRDAVTLTGSYDLLYTGTSAYLYVSGPTFLYMDSPASISALTYKTRFRSHIGSASVSVGSGNLHVFEVEGI